LLTAANQITGNALRPSDIIDVDGRKEVRYRAGLALAFASDLVLTTTALSRTHAALINYAKRVGFAISTGDIAARRDLDLTNPPAAEVHVIGSQ
jgi:hypothetical protein